MKESYIPSAELLARQAQTYVEMTQDPAALSLLDTLTQNARMLRYIESGMLRKLRGLSPSEMAGDYVFKAYPPLVRSAVEAATAFAHPGYMAEVVLAGTPGHVDPETFTQELSLDEVYRAYALFSLDAHMGDIARMQTFESGSGFEAKLHEYNAHGLHLSVVFRGGGFRDRLAGNRLTSPYVSMHISKQLAQPRTILNRSSISDEISF